MKNEKSTDKIRLSFLVLFILSGSFVQAQIMDDFGQKREMIKSQKIAYITDQLKLTPPEAEKFWPVYNEFEAKRENLLILHKGSDLENINIDLLSDKEVEKLADEEIALGQELLNLKKEYHEKFKTILPIRKVLKLYQAEREFQRVLLRRIKEQNPPRNQR